MSNPATMETAAKMRRAGVVEVLLNSLPITGANIDPTLAHMEDDPKPVWRNTVGYSSAAYK